MIALKTEFVATEGALPTERSVWLLRCLGPASTQRTLGMIGSTPKGPRLLGGGRLPIRAR